MALNYDAEREGGRRAASARGNWGELIVLFLIAVDVYVMAALFNSSWVGQSGGRLGEYLRTVWGGAVLIPLLFLLYLCFARLVRFRIPRPLGQVLGTAQLYVSLAFMLGIARHVGWNPAWSFFEPGEVGRVLARLFVLNLGMLGALLAAAASFLLAAFFFGSRLLALFVASLPVGAPEEPRSGEADAASGREQPPSPSFPARQAAARSEVYAEQVGKVHPLHDALLSAEAQAPEDGARLVRHTSPGGVPFDPLTPVTPNGLAGQGFAPEPLRMPQGQGEDAPAPPDDSSFVPAGPKEVESPISTPSLQRGADVPGAEPPAVDEASEVPAEPSAFDRPPSAAPDGAEPSHEAPHGGVSEAAQPKRTTVEILDDLLSSLEAGAFSARPDLLKPLDDEVPPPAAEPQEVPLQQGGPAGTPEEPAASAAPQTAPPAPPQPPQDPAPRAASASEGTGGASGARDRDTAQEHDGRDTALQAEVPEVVLPEEVEERRSLEGVFPPQLDLFGPPVEDVADQKATAAAAAQGEVIVETLKNFGITASIAHIVIGPSVVQFQIELAPGTKVNKVAGLANDLTMALAVVSVRVEAPILGQHYVGIEIPNSKRRGIPLRMAMESPEFAECQAVLPLQMGMQVDSSFLVCGLEDMPHLLVAGTTGSGKSVFVNACILGMCSRRTPDELKLILVDPKHVEFAIYEGLPHLLARPISDSRKAIDALTWAVQEMETRTENFARARVRSLAPYNEKVLPKDRYPNIVVVVDELADLMYTAGKEVEGLIARLAQKSRAAGIHLILATQRPSVDVITGLIKANVPARVAFAVPSQTDSRTIIDAGGADKLLGKGDMLFRSTRFPRPLRLQSPFITEERTLDFVEYMKGVFGLPDYIEFADSNGGGGGDGRGGNGAVDDPKMEEAIRTVMETGITSASGLQRLLSIGYPKAGRLITAMEQLGIVGPQTPNSTKPRQILLDEESAFEALERARTGGIFDED
ncbi:DNA translocase FtsK [Fretibacterium fastidiosum]|uniref:DNA translocase FtsK n=1 Tax=Fretibacterium fastidiosum TaxID=651822 RepID=UPI0002D9AF24|nr:DNA translocase FtsK [Fretibacterium fastidiosum]